MTTQRQTIGRLRGLLYDMKFAIVGDNDTGVVSVDPVEYAKRMIRLEDDLNALLPQIEEALDKSADAGPAPEAVLPWRQGFVEQRGEYQPLRVGQVWQLAEAEMATSEDGQHFDRTLSFKTLDLQVISLSPEGEVQLRPKDWAAAEKIYPEHLDRLILKKDGTPLKEEGESVFERPCPFQWVRAKEAKESKGVKVEGDLFCHEAWSLWVQLVLCSG